MTGMSDALRLAELVCARLCHDLSSPLGALVGVLEAARDDQPDSEAVALAEEAAIDLAERLKLLRAAWGPNVDEVDVVRLRTFAACLSTSRRVRLDLTGLDADAVFQPAVARLTLNLVLLAAESLPGGGIISLAGSPAHRVVVTISGPRAAWPAGLASWLNDDAAAWEALLASPRGLQAPLTALLARGLGLRLSILMPAGVMTEQDPAPPLLLSLERE